MIRKILNSKVYKVVDFIVRLMLLNILLIMISSSLFIIVTTFVSDLKRIWYLILLIPTILTIFPSVVALTEVIKSYIIDKNTGLLKDFFRFFAKHFFKAMLVGIILSIFILLLVNSYFYFDATKLNGPIYMIGYILTLSFSLILLLLAIHMSLVFVYFSELNIIQIAKISFIIAFKELGITLVLVIIAFLSIILSYYFQIYLILFAFSLVIYFNVLLTKRIYIKLAN